MLCCWFVHVAAVALRFVGAAASAAIAAAAAAVAAAIAAAIAAEQMAVKSAQL